MTYFERLLKEKNLKAFIQKEEHSNYLRYALILNEDNDGIVFGYVGSGEYDFALLNNGFQIQYVDEEEELLGWDENIDEWAHTHGKCAEDITDMLNMTDILGDSLNGSFIELGSDYLPLFDNSCAVSFGIDKPIDFGNTSFN